MKKSTIWLAILTLVCAVCVACGSSGNGPGGNTPTGGMSLTVQAPRKTQGKKAQTGRFGSDITLESGAELNSLTYTLSNSFGNSYTGTVDVSGADPNVPLSNGGTAATFLIPGVAPGKGYTVTITGQTKDLEETCDGLSSTFTVLPKVVTSESVNVLCTVASANGDAGDVLVTLDGEECPTWLSNNVDSNWFHITSGGVQEDSTYLTVQATDIAVPSITWLPLTGGGSINTNVMQTEGLNTYVWLTQWICGGTGTETVQFTISDGYQADETACPSTDYTGVMNIVCP